MLGNVPAARKPINPANTTAVFPISQQSRCWLRVRILQRPQNLVLWALIHPLSGFQEGRWTKYRPCAYSPVSLKPAHSRAPPSVVVRAQYPGANPKVIAETVATPLEESINGVEGMLYMGSQATTDGVMTLTVTFALGTDPDKAQQLVQNRAMR